jgi:hypothetical protein
VTYFTTTEGVNDSPIIPRIPEIVTWKNKNFLFDFKKEKPLKEKNYLLPFFFKFFFAKVFHPKLLESEKEAYLGVE